jgi:hypothetical protein
LTMINYKGETSSRGPYLRTNSGGCYTTYKYSMLCQQSADARRLTASMIFVGKPGDVGHPDFRKTSRNNY